MEVEHGILLYALVILLITVVVGLLLMMLQARRRDQQHKQLQRELAILKQTVSALCSTAVGVDRRVNRVERYSRDLAERQDNIETLRQSDPPYAEAIRMVKEGADVARLVRELGLSEGAADLIIMIHGLNHEQNQQK
jgi:hypothetical protein